MQILPVAPTPRGPPLVCIWLCGGRSLASQFSGKANDKRALVTQPPEAEIVAADFALRTAGIPSLAIWSVVLPRIKKILFHEDNQAMIQVVKSGRNPTMRHVGRTHRVSVAELHQMFQRPEYELVKESSSRMAADMYTKAFTDHVRWQIVCELIKPVDPVKLKDSKYVQELLDYVPPEARESLRFVQTTTGGAITFVDCLPAGGNRAA